MLNIFLEYEVVIRTRDRDFCGSRPLRDVGISFFRSGFIMKVDVIAFGAREVLDTSEDTGPPSIINPEVYRGHRRLPFPPLFSDDSAARADER